MQDDQTYKINQNTEAETSKRDGEELIVAAQSAVQLEDIPTAAITAESDDTPNYAKSFAAKKEEIRTVPLSKKEINSLKNHHYEQAIKKFSQSFVIMNKKTGMVVEVRAASSFHACTMMGWRFKNCRVIKVVEHPEVKPVETPEEIIEIVEKKAGTQTVEPPA